MTTRWRDDDPYGRLNRVGRSSVNYRIGLFQGDGDAAAAEGRFAHVYVDNTDPAGRVTPVPDVVRAAVGPLRVAIGGP